MKTLFVNPNNRNPMGDLAAIEPPLWLLLMASHYMEDGKDVRALDAEAENLTLPETVERVLVHNADEVVIVVMGNNPSVSSTPKFPAAYALWQALKDHMRTYLTGIHPMAAPSPLYVSLTWRPIKCLDLHYELLPMDKYRAHNWHCLDGSPRSPYASIYTSLGCPFDCYYCNIHTLYKGRGMFFRNPVNVIQEVDRLVYRFGVRNIKIWDELFALKEQRVLYLSQMFRNYDLNIWAYARVDTVTEKMLHAMKEGGVNWLAYGFENASASVRQQADKNFSESKVEKAIRWTREAGINIMGNFTFGLPGETEESATASLDFAKSHLFEFVNFYVALPYPGSRWWAQTKGEVEWSDFDQYGKNDSPWFAFRDKAFKDYFSNPAYQEMVGRKFGDSGLSEIRKMLAFKRAGSEQYASHQ